MNWFRFQCRLDRVVDGDTVDVVADLGFRARAKARIRLRGIDTAEMYGVKHESDEYALGVKQQEFVEDWFARNDDCRVWPFVLDTDEDTGKYGRWPGDITPKSSTRSLTQAIIEEYPDVDH